MKRRLETHARKSARAKTYEYRILNRPNRSPLHRHYAWWIAPPPGPGGHGRGRRGPAGRA